MDQKMKNYSTDALVAALSSEGAGTYVKSNAYVILAERMSNEQWLEAVLLDEIGNAAAINTPIWGIVKLAWIAAINYFNHSSTPEKAVSLIKSTWPSLEIEDFLHYVKGDEKIVQLWKTGR